MTSQTMGGVDVEKLNSWTETAVTVIDDYDYYQNTSNITDLPSGCQIWDDFQFVSNVVFIVFTFWSMLACLLAIFVYILIRHRIFGHGPQKKDSTQHWINWNFLISFILRDLFLMVIVISNTFTVGLQLHAIVVVFYTFIVISNFFWMFAEGLWLYFGVFCAHQRPRWRYMRVKMCGIGCAIPGVLACMWAVTEAVRVLITEDFTMQNVTRKAYYNHNDWPGLVWVVSPIYLILVINLAMMARLLWKFPGLFQYRPRRRLAKAIIALAILLGMGYIVPIIIVRTLAKTGNCHALQVVNFVNNILSALQGFFVAIFCVLTNKQVKQYCCPYIPIFTIFTSKTKTTSREKESQV